MKQILYSILAVFLCLGANAQSVQECLAIVGNSQTASNGDQVCVEFTTRNFEDVAGLQYTHSFDETVLEFSEVVLGNAISISEGNFGVLQAGAGTVQFSWISLNADNVSLSDNSLLYSLCFDVIGQATESSNITLSGEQTAIEAITLVNFNPVEINLNGVSGKVAVDIPVNGPAFDQTCSAAASCGSTTSGYASVGVSGGVSPYAFTWIGPNEYVNFTQNVNDLAPGYYTCETTDADGNTALASFYITSNGVGGFDIDAEVNATTCGANDGSILINNGGTDPLTYSWSNGANTQSITGLAAGTYYLTVSNGICQEAFVYSIAQNALVSVSGQVTNNTSFCTGDPNGSIELTTSGGVAPYTFLWSNGEESQNIYGLFEGVYTATITDENGCQVVENFNVLDIGLATNYTYNCVNDDSGVVTFLMWSTADLTTGLTFEWSNGTTTTPSNDYLNDGNAITEVAFSGTSSLTVTISDDNGCSYTETLDNINCGSNCDDLVLGHTWECTIINDDEAMVTFTTIVWNPDAATAPFEFAYSNGVTITGAEINDYVIGEFSIVNPTDTVSLVITDAAGCTFTYEYNDFECGNSGGDCADDWLIGEAFECTTFTDFSQAEVTVALWSAPSGVAPFAVEWDNGEFTAMTEIAAGSYTASSIYVNPDNLITYTIIDAAGCQTTGSVPVDCPDPTPDPGAQNADCGVSLIGAEVNAAVGSNVCVPFTANSTELIVSMQYTLEWDPAILSFTGLQGFGLNGVSELSFGQNFVNTGKLTYSWFDPNVTGVMLTSDVAHYEVCYDVIGNTGDLSTINFVSAPTEIEVGNADLEAIDNVQLIHGYVGVDTWDNTISASVNCQTNWLCQSESDGFIDVIFYGGAHPLTFEWTGPNGFTANTEDLNGVGPGIYNVIGTDANGNSAWIVVEIVTANCIWPGDTDNSGIVDNYDLLNIGLGFSAIGPARADASTDWTGQYGDDWNVATPNSNTNHKHTDADGSGVINEIDVEAINLNWGLSTDGLSGGGSERDLPVVVNNAPTIPIYVEEAQLEEAQAASLAIMLGDDSNEVMNAYGIAFSIEYNNEYVVGGSAAISIDNSWLGDMNNDLLMVQKDFYAEGRIDVAITRKDGFPVTGFGEIGRLDIVIEDIIFSDNNESEEIVLVPFKITNVLVINEIEEAIASEGMETYSELNTGTATNEQFISEQVNVFPNPASDFVNVHAGSLMMNTLTVFDVTGKLLMQQEVNNITAKIDVKTLAEGTYLLKVSTLEGIANKRIVIIK